jgi:hypothetical protein
MKRAGLLAIAAAAIAIGVGGSTAQAVPGGSALKAAVDVQSAGEDMVTQVDWRRYRHCHRRWHRGHYHRYCHGGRRWRR